MAFDRTTPAATNPAAPDAPPPVRYILEFGHTYVRYEEQDGFRLLNDAQQAVLADWADALIPGEQDVWPSASDANAHLYADNCAAKSPQLRALLTRAILRLEQLAAHRTGHGFCKCDPSTRENLLRELEQSEHAELFELVLELIHEGYYRDPAVLHQVQERTGFQVMAPVEGVELTPFDPASLARVKALPPRVRPADP
jgi:Gluconate 2-dehydrogenase subunit 3